MYDFKNYGFWKCGSNTTCSYICDRKHEWVIYKILNLFALKTYVYLTCSARLGIQNISFKVVNQDRNDTYHVYNLCKKDF